MILILAGNTLTIDMIEFALYTYLSSQTTITDIVGTMIFPGHIPQDTSNFTATYPAIVFNLIDDVPVNNLSGFAGLSRARLQIDCYSDESNKAVINLTEVIRLKLHGYRGLMSDVVVNNCKLETSQTMNQPPIDGSDDWTYRKRSDYTISYYANIPDFS